MRPLIAGSMGRQPFWIKEYGSLPLENADLVNKHGFYLPNNHELKTETIKAIKEILLLKIQVGNMQYVQALKKKLQLKLMDM